MQGSKRSPRGVDIKANECVLKGGLPVVDDQLQLVGGRVPGESDGETVKGQKGGSAGLLVDDLYWREELFDLVLCPCAEGGWLEGEEDVGEV